VKAAAAAHTTSDPVIRAVMPTRTPAAVLRF
jgi:hypothetical protein